MSKKRLLVISVDALNSKDFDYISSLPNFKQFMEKGSYVRRVDPIYPSMTYCCHTSISTGTYPKHHGIANNQIMNPEYLLCQDWHWHRKDIKVPTLFDLAKKKGLKTGAILWPVTAGDKKGVDYNVPEIWSDRGESSFKLFLKNGSLKLLPYIIKHKHMLDGKKQPNTDNFSEAVALDIIRKKKPELMTIHYTELDSTRHYDGVWSDEAYQVLNKMDDRIGKVLQAYKDNGTYDDTNFVVLGDHGGNDFTKIVFINGLLHREGLITLADDNKSVVSWEAFANTCGGAVQVHLHNPNDKVVYKKVEEILHKLSVMPRTPIKHFFKAEEVLEEFNVKGTFEFMLEAKDGFIFRDHIKEEVILDRTELPHAYHAEHGYLPTHENLKTMFFAMGPDVKTGSIIEKACLVDEGPTLAALLGLSYETPVDGSLLDILRI